MDYTDKCKKVIPIGIQKFAYQCETIVLEPLFGTMNIRGYIPFEGGKEPYPNEEKELIEHYDLKVEKFTQKSIDITLTKKHKDGSEELIITNVSFSDLVNRIFEGNPANFINKEAPKRNIELVGGQKNI